MSTRSPQLTVRPRFSLLLLPVVLAGALAVGACSVASSPAPTAASGVSAAKASPVVSTSASPAPAASPAAASPASPVAGSKVNANSASQDEITQALGSVGVANSARWAREVMEYRPYPTNDPSFAKLRQELAKYNPGPGVVDQIISALSL